MVDSADKARLPMLACSVAGGAQNRIPFSEGLGLPQTSLDKATKDLFDVRQSTPRGLRTAQMF